MAANEIHIDKVCRKCALLKPDTLQFFGHGAPGKLSGTCRKCALARIAQRRKELKASDPDKLREKDRRVAATQDKAKRLERNRLARLLYPDRYREYDRRKYERHGARARAAAKEAYQRTEPELRRERHAEWRAKSPAKLAKIRERRAEKVKGDPVEMAKAAERMRRWRAKNPTADSATRDRRRAREVSAVGEYTRDDVSQILRDQGRFCFYCQAPLTKFQCDHFIPLARGGSNTAENIVLSCPSCNYSKGAKMPWEWQPNRFSEGQSPR